MAIVEKFNKFIDEVNLAELSTIPHGDSILECVNNYLEGKGLVSDRYTALDEATYALAVEANDPGEVATQTIANLNLQIENAVLAINTTMSSEYESLSYAVEAVDTAYSTAAGQVTSLEAGDANAVLAINTELSSSYETLSEAVAGLIAAYEAAITPANPEVTG